MTIRAVLFDFYGTLAEAEGGGPTWSEMFRALGYEMSQEASRRLWNEGADGAEHDEHSQSRDHYVAWQHSRVREIITESGVAEGDDDLLFSHITERLGRATMRAYADSRPTMDALRERGIRLAICSNWDWDLREALAAAGLEGVADVVVSSAWVGARKPHARIYADTLARLDIDPADAVFVGDTWTCDVEGPRAFGMTPVYLRRPHFGADITAPDAPDPSVVRASDLSVVVDLATGALPLP